jgi:hypothetical protein
MEYGRSRATKNPRPSLRHLEKGRECRSLNRACGMRAKNCIPIHTRGATLIAFQSHSNEMPYAGHTLPYHIVAKVERPLFPGYCLRGNHPPVPTCLPMPGHLLLCPHRKLSSDSHSRRRSEKAHPFRTSTLLRIAVGHLSHTMFVQRGSVCIKFSLNRE